MKRRIILYVCLYVLFTSANCAQRPSPNDNHAIAVTVLYVHDDQYPSIAREQLAQWVDQSRTYLQQQTGIELTFAQQGPISPHEFFKTHYDSSMKDPELEVYRIHPDDGEFDQHRDAIVSILRTQDLAALNELSFPYVHYQAKTVEDLYTLITKQYALSLQQAKQRHIITGDNYTYRSAMNWSYLMRTANPYTLLVTNAPILQDTLKPWTFYIHATGAFAFGFSHPGKAAVLSTYGGSPTELDHVMPNAISHELGHTIFFLEDALDDTGSIMSALSTQRLAESPLSSFNLTAQEKKRARAAILYLHGYEEFEHGRLNNAIDTLRQVVIDDPEAEFAYSSLAKVYIQEKHYAEAERTLRTAIQLRPNDAYLYEMLGDLLWPPYGNQAHWPQENIKLYQKALELNPFLIGSRINLAEAYQLLNDTERVLEEYQKVIRLDPENLMALKQLGEMHSHQGDCKAVMRIYEQLIKLDATYAEAYYRMGLCQEQRNRHRAETYYKKYLELEPLGEYSDIVKGFLVEMNS